MDKKEKKGKNQYEMETTLTNFSTLLCFNQYVCMCLYIMKNFRKTVSFPLELCKTKGKSFTMNRKESQGSAEGVVCGTCQNAPDEWPVKTLAQKQSAVQIITQSKQ